MPSSIQISVEAVNFQSSLEKQLAAFTKGTALKVPFDTKSITDFNYQLDRATQRVVTLGTAFTVLNTVNRAIKEMVASTIQVEKSLTDVNAVFNLTNESMNRFSSNLFDISRDTATSFSDVAKAATEFARQGLSVANTQKAVSAALMLSRDANISVEESVKATTSAVNIFNKEALTHVQVANQLTAVTGHFAVSQADLAEALTHSGAAAADAGLSFKQFIGLVTSAEQITQRGGTAISTALGTIFSRINKKDTLDALDSLGIKITDVQDRALPMIDVLSNVAKSYDKMSQASKSSVDTLLGGSRQLSILKALFRDLATEGSSFARVQEVISRGSSELDRRNALRNQTLSARVSQVGTTAQQIGSNIGNVGISAAVKPVFDTILNNPITKAFEDANGSAETAGGQAAELFLKGLGSALVFGAAPLFARVFLTVGKQVLGNLGVDLIAATGLQDAAKQREATEAEIVALYKQGGVALQTQLEQMTSLAARAAYVRQILDGAGSAFESVGPIAGEVLAQRRRTPGAAGGFLPYAAEGAAVAAGVGGAPPGARPVYLPDFNRGGGQMGIVANSSEFVVPGAAGGAIYNRDMIQRYGLPAGSTPVAAGGYVPNAAGGSYSASELGLGFSQAGNEKIAALNELFVNLTKAGTVAEASQFGPQIADIAQSLNKTAGLTVLKDLFASMNRFAYNFANTSAAKRTNGAFAVIPGGLGVDETDAAAAARIGNISPSAAQLGTRLSNPLTRTRAEAYYKRDFHNLRLDDLDYASGLGLGGGVNATATDRFAAGQIARAGAGGSVLTRQGVNYGQLNDAFTASRGLQGGQTIQEQFNKTVKDLLDSGKGLNTAYNAAIAQIMGETDSRKQINSVIRNSIPVQVAYEKELADSRLAFGLQRKQLQSDINQQVTLNSAIQQRAGGKGINQLAAPERTALINQIRQQVIQDLGFGGNVPGALSNPASRFQIQQELAQRVSAQNAYALPVGPAVAVNNPSLYSRLSQRAGTLQGTLALGLGLPFLGGLVPDAEGGTPKGQAFGAAKSALDLAGTGATVGSFAGPAGTLVGTLIGAGLGALYGAITKSTKSFEELSTELDQKNKKLGEELNNVLQVFKDKSTLNIARKAGNQEQVVALTHSIAAGEARTRDPDYRSLYTQFAGDPEGGAIAAANLGNNRKIGPSLLQSSLIQSLAKGETSRGDKYGSYLFGGAPGFSGFFNNAPSDDDNEHATNAIGNVLAKLTPDQRLKLRAGLGANGVAGPGFPKGNLSQAAGQIAGFAGIDQAGILDIRNKIESDPKYAKLFRTGLTTSLDDFDLQQPSDAAAQDLADRRERGLSADASGYRVRASFNTTTKTANRSIAQIQNQIALANPALTDFAKLQLQGSQGAASIGEQAGSQRTSDIYLAQGKLLDLLSKDKSASPAFEERIKGLNANNLQSFIDDLSNPDASKRNGLTSKDLGVDGSPFVKELEALSAQLKDSIFAQSENTRAQTEGNKLLLDELTKQKTFPYAVSEDQGAVNRTTETLTSARARKDSAATIRNAQYASTSAGVELLRRTGVLSDSQAGTYQLGLGQSKSFTDRQEQFNFSQGLGSQFRVDQGIKSGDLTLKEQLQAAQDALKIGVRSGDEEASLNDLRTKLQDLTLENQFRNTDTLSEGGLRLSRLQNRATTVRNGQFTTSSDVSSTDFALAKERGQQGDSKGSFTGGFGSVFDGAKKDIKDFSDVGKQVADGLQSSFTNAFDSFITGASNAKDAFHSFILGVFQDSARAFATKSVTSLLGLLLGNIGGGGAGASAGSTDFSAITAAAEGSDGVPFARGGVVKRAGGGNIPTMLTGGEFVYPPAAASRIGGRMLGALNSGTMRGFAPGGLVRGGSGVRDDVFQPLAAGSYVVRKSMVERYGADHLAALAGGGDVGVTTPMYAMAGGGPMTAMMATPTVGAVVGGGGSNVNIGVNITDNSTTTSSSQSDSQGGSSLNDRQFSQTLANRVKQVTLQTIQEQQRIGGVLRIQSAGST